MTDHAWSGARRVPLQLWQVQPFRFETPAPKPSLFWTPARTNRLTKLIKSGLKAREISDVFGCDKQCVVRKARSLGLSFLDGRRTARGATA